MTTPSCGVCSGELRVGVALAESDFDNVEEKKEGVEIFDRRLPERDMEGKAFDSRLRASCPTDVDRLDRG